MLFNSNDYYLNAYDKSNGQLQWKHYMGWKSNVPPFFVDSTVWMQTGENEAIQLNLRTGSQKGKLPVSTVETKPAVKNNILYATGIYNGGCLFAYDLKADTVLWYRFLAHGCSITPYYLQDRIIANAEGNNWLEIGYDGALIAKGCDSIEVGYPSELPCVKQFIALSHDGKEIREDFLQRFFSADAEGLSFYNTAHHTFIAGNSRLLVLGDNLKGKKAIEISSLSDSLELEDDESVSILQADESNVWMLIAGRLILYDYQNKKLVKAADLSPWEPHQVVPDGERLWLISRKDGLLYGLTW